MMDVLTNVLSALRLRSSVYCQSAIATEQWSLQFEQTRGAVFHVVQQGQCWLEEDATRSTTILCQGDLLVLPRGQAHRMTSHPLLTPMVTIDLDAPEHEYELMHWGDNPQTVLICGTFNLEAAHGHPLLPLLPDQLHFNGENLAHYGLEQSVHALINEANSGSFGVSVVLTRLADVLFVQVLRAWLAQPQIQASNWLTALRDPDIAQALSHIHAAPEQAWTVEQLAARVALSRSAFAARFADRVGETPLSYLRRWRMNIASRLLQQTNQTLTAIARRVGYASEAAFSKAFKQELGESPGAYRKRHKT
jgi:AraC-like DNA-binding protein/mannose-6-phosphate isomerase-like protein (cupin superfamily)